MNLSSKVMRSELPWVCVALAALCAGARAAACERGRSWWDRARGVCAPCTVCDPARRLAVRLPCEPHRDTVCHSLFNLRLFPYPEPDNNITDYYDDVYYDSEVSDSADDDWSLETSSLTLAASGCVVFFVVVLVLSLYHAKQWKVLKQALKSDVQDLTAKLKLMESGGDSAAEPVVATDHHIYCNIHVGKEALLGSNSAKGLGNVYTQEKHPS